LKLTITLVAFLGMLPFSSAKHYPMTNDASVPGASGTVTVQKDKDNGNMKLEVKVEHLANPASLTPPSSTYLVWVRPNGGDAVKEGVIRVDKNLSGDLKVVTTSKEFDVFITPEQSDSVSAPATLQVLRAHVSPL
jgi:hypothetical protein